VFLRFVWALALAGAFASSPAVADASSLTLSVAVDRAVASNPALGAERAAIRASEQQARLDGLAPPMTVGGEMENFAGTGELGGFDDAEFTVRVGKTFELGGKREARQALGSTQVALQGNELERRRLDIVTRTKHRFLEVLAQQARLSLAEQESALARETREAVAYRVKRGASPEADLPLAELAVARAELEQEDAAHELESARVTLAVLWGERSPSFTRAAGSVDTVPDVPAFETLVQRLESSPDQQLFSLEASRLDAQRRAAEASRKPDLTGTLGVRRLEAFDDQALVMSIAMPVGLAQRSDLALARGRAELESLEQRRKSVELERYQELFARYQELQHARHEFETVRDRMIPAAESALALARRGYDEARYSFLQVAAARNVLHALQKDRIAAATRYHRLLADIERATAVSGVNGS
jgi:cobalt-zinc-cadmium efflux system outer membrane protein